jgi:hypothetical protein
VLRALSKALLICLLVCGVSGYWAVLQSVAWATMLVENVQHAPVVLALQKTFDGKHPCRICKVVAEGKKSEQRQEAQTQGLKIELICELEAVPMPLAPEFSHAFNAAPVLNSRTESPPVPPPRLS